MSILLERSRPNGSVAQSTGSGTLIISGKHKIPCNLPFICLCSCMNCGDSTAAECVVGFLASQQTLHASDLDREQTRFCCCEDPCSESTILVHCYKHTAVLLLYGCIWEMESLLLQKGGIIDFPFSWQCLVLICAPPEKIIWHDS